MRLLSPVYQLRNYSKERLNNLSAKKANCYQVTELGFEPWQPDPSAILMYIILHHLWGCFYAHFHVI